MCGPLFIAGMQELRNAYKIYIENPQEKRSPGRHRFSWEDILKTIAEKWDVKVWTAFN
jgi:hypothetical protein